MLITQTLNSIQGEVEDVHNEFQIEQSFKFVPVDSVVQFRHSSIQH